MCTSYLELLFPFKVFAANGNVPNVIIAVSHLLLDRR